MIIKSKRIYMKDGCKAGYLQLEGKKITAFYPIEENIKADIDYGNNRIMPGIFDTHNHGGFGYSLISGQETKENIIQFLKNEASFGVVNILPTTSGLDNIELLAQIADDENYVGPKILGIHSEGPWGARVGEKGVNVGYPAVDLEYGQKMIDASQGKLVLVDIAPEVENGLTAISFFKDHNINVGLFHTNANYLQANEGIKAGATVATHLGNVMTGIHHRDVGTLGACLLSDEVDCEMICDGLHISLPMIQLYLKAKDHDKLFMISDNVEFAGIAKGTYDASGYSNAGIKYVTANEEGFVLTDTGRLFGSCMPVLFGIKNLVEKLNVPLEECCKFFCYNPIRKYSDPCTKGALDIDKDGDFVVISDDYQAIATYSEGKCIYDCQKDKIICNPKIESTRI